MTTTSYRATLTLPSDTEIFIVRDFKGPRARVFDAWSKPEFIRRWYGCDKMEMQLCEVDFREGGTWRFVIQNPADGIDHAFSGEYHEIARPGRLVFNERYEPIPGSDRVITLTFDEHAGVTTMKMHMQYASVHHRDGHMQSGMEPGLQASLDRLDELVQSGATASE